MKNYFNTVLLVLLTLLFGVTAIAQPASKPIKSGKKLNITQFDINGNSENTSNRLVTLDFVVENGTPTKYSVSEDPAKVGKIWTSYTCGRPTFLLSKGVGLKDIYFAVANGSDTSEVQSASIYLDESVVVKSNGLTAKLFPNPVENNLNIEVVDNVPSVSVVVYSLSGQIYLSRTFNSKIISLDLSSCPTGVLLVRLSSGNKYVIQRVIKL